jgi:hypothetical protein
MKITLEQREIQAALEAYVQDQIPMVQGMDFAIELSGTTNKGFEAALTVAGKANNSGPVDEAPSKPVKRATPVKKAAPLAAVVEEPACDITSNPEARGEGEPVTEDVEDTVEDEAETPPAATAPKKGGPVFQFAKKG